jgi:hypothetical protein
VFAQTRSHFARFSLITISARESLCLCRFMRERKYIDPGAPFGSAGCQVLKLEEDTAKVVRPFQPISLGGQALRPLGVSAAARSVQPELDQLSDRLRGSQARDCRRLNSGIRQYREMHCLMLRFIHGRRNVYMPEFEILRRIVAPVSTYFLYRIRTLFLITSD